MNMRKRDTPARIRLTDCGTCKLPFVQPVLDECREVGEAHWHLVLRCGNCGVYSETMVTQAEADWFDDDLDAYEHKVRVFLKLLAHENFEDDIERFVSALDADAILPEDFRV